MNNPLIPGITDASAGVLGLLSLALSGFLTLILLTVFVALAFLLVRFLLVATRAAQLYVAKNAPAVPTASPTVTASPATLTTTTPTAVMATGTEPASATETGTGTGTETETETSSTIGTTAREYLPSTAPAISPLASDSAPASRPVPIEASAVEPAGRPASSIPVATTTPVTLATTTTTHPRSAASKTATSRAPRTPNRLRVPTTPPTA